MILSKENAILKGRYFIITCYIAISNMMVELIFVENISLNYYYNITFSFYNTIN